MKSISSEECKEIELGIFKKVIEICEDHNLRYIVDYGSLIGIVRHGGFIPWDDDIDISMPRPDYEVFKKVFSGTVGKDSKYQMRTGTMSNLALPYIQVVHTDTITEKKGRRDAFAQAVWVDVFPVDGAGDRPEQCEEVYQKYWEKINESRQVIGRYRPYLNPWKQLRQFYQHHIKRLWLGKIISDAEQRMQTYDYDSSEQIFCYCTIYGTKEKNDKKFYEDRIDMEFEGITCKVPREFDKKLRGIYGDYMTPPPESDRKGHEFHAWWIP